MSPPRAGPEQVKKQHSRGRVLGSLEREGLLDAGRDLKPAIAKEDGQDAEQTCSSA